MKVMMKPLLVAGAIAMSLNAYAANVNVIGSVHPTAPFTKDITVTATVAETLDLTAADGTPLPATINLNYAPGVGLQESTTQTKIWSNHGKDIGFRLQNTAELTAVTGGGAPVPLKVSFAGYELGAVMIDIPYKDMFPVGDPALGSKILPLVIAQATKGAVTTGSYSGTVSLVIIPKA